MRTCTLCGSKHYARGLCNRHYKQDTSTRPRRKTTNMSDEERFDYYASPQNEKGCILWIGTPVGGYGRFYYKRGYISAHRFAYQRVNGPIPEGMCVCHACDTPLCVNPEHLFLGTNKENTADKTFKNRQHCKVGKPDIEAIINDTRPAGVIARHYRISTKTVGDIRLGNTRKALLDEHLAKQTEYNREGMFDYLKGTNNHFTKLTTDDVLAIRDDSRTYREIAETYGVSQGSVHAIKHRKRWAWLK